MPTEAPTHRLPRYVRRPRDIPSFEITERDEEILKIIGRYRIATSAHITALITVTFPGSSEQAVLRRLHLLYHGGYLSRPKAQVEVHKAGGGSKAITYALGNHGADYLAQKFGFRRPSVDFTATARTAVRLALEHSTEITEFVSAIETSCRRRGNLALIPFDEILRTLAPEDTRRSRRPDTWAVAVRWKGQDVVLHTTPDAIFGICDLDRPEGRNRKFYYLEADRGTMPTVRRDLTKTSILRKLVAYGFAHTHRIHERRFSFPNIRTVTVTPGRQRIRNIIDAYREHVAAVAPAGLYLFADRASLSRSADILEFPFLDAAGNQIRLLD